MLVSVIVPAYKTCNYIRKCLSSLKDQSFFNIEVLVICVSGDDETILVVKDFIKRDNRFSLYISNVANVSIQRNIGIKECNGDFFTFVDSDDYVLKDYIFNLIKFSDGVDCVFSLPISPALKDYPKLYKEEVVTFKKIAEVIHSNVFQVYPPVGKLFRKSSCGLSLFDERMKCGEDSDYIFSVLIYDKPYKVVRFIDYRGYVVVINNDSVTSSFKNNHLSMVLYHCKLLDYCKKSEKESLKQCIAMFYRDLKFLYFNCYKYKIKPTKHMKMSRIKLLRNFWLVTVPFHRKLLFLMFPHVWYIVTQHVIYRR